MTLRNVNLSLGLKTQLKLTKTPRVLSIRHNFTVNTEICTTRKLIPQKHTNNPTKKYPTKFNFLTSSTIIFQIKNLPLRLTHFQFYEDHLKITH